MHAFRYALLSAALLLAGCAGMPMQPIASAPAETTPSSSGPAQPVNAMPAPAATAGLPVSGVKHSAPQAPRHMPHSTITATPKPPAAF